MGANLTKLVLTLGLLFSAAPLVASSAGAQGPTTCLAEVAGAPFDEEPAFAGRLRSFAGDADDPAIVRRSLRCPYRTAEGQSLELILDWDERPSDRFTCTDDVFDPEGEDPSRTVLEHPELQAAIVASGPDRATVAAMEDAARLTLVAVPAAAAACSEPVLGTSRSPLTPWLLLLAIPVVVGGVLLHRRRGASAHEGPPADAPAQADDAGVPAPAADALTVALTAELAGTEAEIRRLEAIEHGERPDVDRLLRMIRDRARTGEVDLLAASTLAAHASGRSALAAAAVSARRELGADSHVSSRSPRRAFCTAVLNIEPTAADGNSVDPSEAKARLVETHRLLTQRLERHRSR